MAQNSIQNILSTTAALFVFGLMLPSSALAQKKDENIGSEVVNVVKPYSPTLSDAYKIKEEAVLDDEEVKKKETVNYQIFSFPVASTFTPSKGRAASLDKAAREKMYDNYAIFGIGNYLNIGAELYLSHEVGSNGLASAMIRHNSSAGGIKDVYLDDSFMTNSVDLAYLSSLDNLSWKAEAGYSHRKYNWYGWDQAWVDGAGVGSTLFAGVEPDHQFQNGYFAGTVDVADSFVDKIRLRYDRTWDGFDSAENHLFLRPDFQFDLGGSSVKLGLQADYLKGEFKRFYLNDLANTYGIFNVSAHPAFTILRDNWTINIGAAFLYSMDGERDRNLFRIYPEAEASLKLVGDLMVFYVGANGGMDQQTYKNASQINPFVSPTLDILPTDRLLEGYAGLKGMLASNVSYDVKGYFKIENEKALYRYNVLPEYNWVGYQPYHFANSFNLIYDDVRTLGFYGNVNADFSKSVSAGLSARFETFTTDKQEEAWNLPAMTLTGKVDVEITPKWYAGAQAFYVGKRKDFLISSAVDALGTTVDVDAYFDLNAHVGYKHNDRLNGFLKFNNLTGQSYQKWLNYPVQGFQIMLGAGYKFDF